MSEASLNLTLAGGTADHSTVSSSTSRPASALKQRGSSRFLNNEEDENLRPLSEMSTGQEQEAEGGREEEPLLGGPGDAQQTRDDPKKLGGNLVLGTAIITQFGIWALAIIVWGSVLTKDIILFSAHPLLNSAGLLLLTQAILILQPTTQSVPKSKQSAAWTHLILNDLGLSALIAGLILIEYNKFQSPTPHHFESAHAICGLITYILLGVQAAVGATAFLAPRAVYGSVANAKATYKYHRASGYVVLTMGLVTVCLATGTTFNAVLEMRLWTLVVASVIVLVGMLPRVQKGKLGL